MSTRGGGEGEGEKGGGEKQRQRDHTQGKREERHHVDAETGLAVAPALEGERPPHCDVAGCAMGQEREVGGEGVEDSGEGT